MNPLLKVSARAVYCAPANRMACCVEDSRPLMAEAHRESRAPGMPYWSIAVVQVWAPAMEEKGILLHHQSSNGLPSTGNKHPRAAENSEAKLPGEKFRGTSPAATIWRWLRSSVHPTELQRNMVP